MGQVGPDGLRQPAGRQFAGEGDHLSAGHGRARLLRDVEGLDGPQHLRLGLAQRPARIADGSVDRRPKGRIVGLGRREGARLSQFVLSLGNPGRGGGAPIEGLDLPVLEPVSFDDDLRMVSGRADFPLARQDGAHVAPEGQYSMAGKLQHCCIGGSD